MSPIPLPDVLSPVSENLRFQDKHLYRCANDKHLSVSVTNDVVVRLDFDRPWWWEATRGGH
jgi:hypothetical protein